VTRGGAGCCGPGDIEAARGGGPRARPHVRFNRRRDGHEVLLRDPIVDRQPPDVMITYALGDEVLPNISTHALLRAIGVDLATPRLVGWTGSPRWSFG